jgi:hypothetical protein
MSQSLKTPPQQESTLDKAKTFISKALPSVEFIDFNNPQTQVCIRNYGIAAICLILTSTVIYKALTVPNINKDDFYLYAAFAIFPIIVGTFVISPLFSENLDTGTAMLYGSLSFIFIIALYLFYRILYPNSVGIISTLMFWVSIIGCIVALSIIYKIFMRFIQNRKSWSGFILRLIFFLPCMLIDLLETLFVELKSAPTMVAVLFVVEIIILLLYFYGQTLITKLYSQNANNLLKDPVFLNRALVIANSETFLLDPNDSLNPTGNKGPNEPKGTLGPNNINVPTYRVNYSVSMWIYVNPRPANNGAYAKESNIFKYGLPSERGKPQITYFNALDISENTIDNYYVYYTNKSSNRFTVQLPGQKWNYLVLSYNDNTVDLFVNGNLEKTKTLDSSTIPEYRSTDVMTVGEGDGTVMNGGLYGSIGNVNYHTVPMTQMQITSEYNSLRYRNPPVP